MSKMTEYDAPWSEDDQFSERVKACRARCKQYGHVCDGSEDAEAEFEGQCVECDYDAIDVLTKRYKISAQPVLAVSGKESSNG